MNTYIIEIFDAQTGRSIGYFGGTEVKSVSQSTVGLDIKIVLSPGEAQTFLGDLSAELNAGAFEAGSPGKTFRVVRLDSVPSREGEA